MPTFDLALLNQGAAKHNRDWNFGPICSSFSRIYWMEKGHATVTIGGKKHKLTEEHLYLIPALTSHYDSCDGEFQQYYIHFVDRTKHVIEYFQQYEMPFELDITNQDKRIFFRLLELCPDIKLRNPQPDTYDTSVGTIEAVKHFRTLPFALRIEVCGLLLQLLARFFNNAKPKQVVSDDRIKCSLYTIERNMEHTPSIGELASDVSLGKDRFIRLFRQQMGMTPTDYIIHHKIHQAQILFIDGNYSIKEVAHMLGYDNISYFGRLFKKITEITPSEFIRQNK